MPSLQINLEKEIFDAGNSGQLTGVVETGDHVLAGRVGGTPRIYAFDKETGATVATLDVGALSTFRDMAFDGTTLFILGNSDFGVVDWEDETGTFGAPFFYEADQGGVESLNLARFIRVNGSKLLIVVGNDVLFFTWSGSLFTKQKLYEDGVDYDTDTAIREIEFIDSNFFLIHCGSDVVAPEKVLYVIETDGARNAVASYTPAGIESTIGGASAVHNGKIFMRYNTALGTAALRVLTFDGVSSINEDSFFEDVYSDANSDAIAIVSDTTYVYVRQANGVISAYSADDSSVELVTRLSGLIGVYNEKGFVTDGSFLYVNNDLAGSISKIQQYKLGLRASILVTPRTGVAPLTVDFSAG